MLLCNGVDRAHGLAGNGADVHLVLIARELDEPVRGRKANDGGATCWCAFGYREQGNSPPRQSTGCRCVSRRWGVAGVQWSASLTIVATVHRVLQPFEVLEPCAGKLARTVPRGRETGNRLLLPGASCRREDYDAVWDRHGGEQRPGLP